MEEMVGVDPNRLILAVAIVAVALVLLVVVLWFLRNRPSSPFIRGGKNRQPRLAVLDAAAIDTRRRLVLVRRDDVEHLVMIGGPTDIVIESRIVARPPQQAPVPQEQAAAPRAEPKPVAAMPSPAAQPPVSAMGPALYGEAMESTPQRRAVAAPPQAAAQQRPPAETAARRPAEGAPLPAAAATPVRQPQTAPSPVTVQKRPEDILDAARDRVLAPVSAPGGGQRPVAATDGARPGAPTEFERVLDAEISGDLQRLAPEPRRADTPPRVTPQAAPQRREPVLGVASAPPQRQEPTIEEEMNRMLNEMAENRKS
ncbi:flagellar biosynthetic protein FliO [Ensifer soli]|uniref:flagellar biosynthetic protein FliO n=1 Tax=Ciceribacter sp. sgz301302 TaxID=3342379 RepID=UPI0035BB059D